MRKIKSLTDFSNFTMVLNGKGGIYIQILLKKHFAFCRNSHDRLQMHCSTNKYILYIA